MSNDSAPVADARYAMPVGTSNLIPLSKFMLDKRDTNCTQCRTGFKSIIPKFVGGKAHQVPVVCTCVPYIASEDKDGNLVVVFKGVREIWPGQKRPEQYIQNDLVRKAEFERAKQNLKNARGQARAHDGVQEGKYQLGVLSADERKALGEDVVKSLAPKFVDSKDPKNADTEKFISNKVIRKVAMRNSEGNIIVVDNDTAVHMMKNKLATPERPADGPIAPPKAEAKGKDAVVKSEGKAVKADGASTVKRGRGRPKGSKNKPKE